MQQNVSYVLNHYLLMYTSTLGQCTKISVNFYAIYTDAVQLCTHSHWNNVQQFNLNIWD